MADKLSDAQRRVLEVVREVGGIHRYRSSLWTWYRRHPEGHISKVCGNATVEVLKQKGLLTDVGFDVVTLTPNGRRALAQKGQRHDG